MHYRFLSKQIKKINDEADQVKNEDFQALKKRLDIIFQQALSITNTFDKKATLLSKISDSYKTIKEDEEAEKVLKAIPANLKKSSPLKLKLFLEIENKSDFQINKKLFS